jgi:TolB-like protein
LAQDSAAVIETPASLARRSRLVRGLVLGAVVAVAAGVLLLTRRPGQDGGAVSRVVVMPFANRTGVTELDPLGAMVAEWVTQGLTAAPYVTVLDTRGALATARALGSAAGPVAVGRETGAEVVVAGSYFLQGESLQFQAQLSSTADGTILFGVGGVTAPRDRPLEGAEQVRQRVLAAFASLHDEDVSTFQTALAQPPTYAAYGAYVDGLELYIRDNVPEAAARFQQAAAHDSTFLTARVWAAQAGVMAGRSDEVWARRADSLIADLQLVKHRLTPFDRARLDFVVAYRPWDLLDAYRAALHMVEAAPGSVDARREAALAALRVLRPREALRYLEDLNPERGLIREWPAYWQAAAWAHHLLGQHEDELAAARRGRRLYPSYSPHLLYDELRALAALGRIAELDSLARMNWPASPGDAGPMAVGIAGELMAHGHAEFAFRLARYAADLPGPRPTSEQAAREWLAQGLNREIRDPYCYLGEDPQTRSPVERVTDEWFHWRAELALLLDDAETAASHAAQLREPGAHGLLLARILAAQGEAGPARAALEQWEGRALRTRGTLGGGLEIDRASVFVLLGDLERGLDVLAEGLGRGAIFNTFWGQDGHAYPDLAPLWSNPRFRALIKPRG